MKPCEVCGKSHHLHTENDLSNCLVWANDENRQLKAEIERLKEIHLKGCDCAPDDACRFARERDEARAKSERLRDALKAIIIRCEEGDPRSNWIPIINDLAKQALAGGEDK